MLSRCGERGTRRGEGTRSRIIGAALAGFVVMGGITTKARGQELPYDRPPIDYLTAPVDDPIARLQKRIERGEVRLDHDGEQGYLPEVLEALGVSPTSQVLVFSKTSFQHSRISPQRPRALYFNDEVTVGWVRGGDSLEIASVDPKQGAVFYLLDQRPTARPTFQRETHTCLSCHASAKTAGVPGFLVRSVYPDSSGMPIYNAGSFVTSHESPFSERWGGWYVSGTHGEQRHMGNVVVHERNRDHPEQLDTEAGANVTDLSDRFDTAPYLTEHSDIVALMVLEHQTQTQNRITAASYHARLAQHYDRGINEALGRPADHLSRSSEHRINDAVEDLVRALLFVGEAPLSDPVAGTSGFAEHFGSIGPRDDQGRSLRDFDLKTRLFRYPCSYLIYSESFDALPSVVKERVYDRLRDILTGQDQSAEFDHLTTDVRREILEILRATKPEFAAR